MLESYFRDDSWKIVWTFFDVNVQFGPRLSRKCVGILLQSVQFRDDFDINVMIRPYVPEHYLFLHFSSIMHLGLFSKFELEPTG